MEPYAAKTCLISLVSDCQLKIATFTTDRSSTIKTMMVSDALLISIKHEYDPWHWISKYLFLFFGAGIIISLRTAYVPIL